MLLTPQSRRKPTPEDVRHLDSIPETAEKMPRQAPADDPSALRQPFFGAHRAGPLVTIPPLPNCHVDRTINGVVFQTLERIPGRLPVQSTQLVHSLCPEPAVCQ